MKVLHVVSSYWPAFEFGGPIESVHLLNKSLVEKGVDLTVYTTNAGLRKKKDIIPKKEIILDGVKIFYFSYFGYVHYTFSPAIFFAIQKNIKNFDLIHITGVWNFPVCAAAFWARFYGKPYIISPRGSLMKEPLEKKSSLKKKIHLFLFAKRDLSGAAAVHFTAEAEKEEYLRAGLLFKKMIMIPNSLDVEKFNVAINEINFKKKFGIGEDKKVVFFISRLSWKKGLDTLIPAFVEVIKKEPKAILVIAGPDDENYKKTIDELIEKYGVKKNVLFTGMLRGGDKISAFKKSDVFVLSSYSENFGMAVAEAMNFGLPVIITKNVGIAPSVAAAGAGLVIDKNEKQLTDAILKILKNPDLGKKMGQAGKKLVVKEFSADGTAEKIIREYELLLKGC